MTVFRPIINNLITQGYGIENTKPDALHFYKELNMLGHNGVDYFCPIGTPIYWPGSGRGTVYAIIDDITFGKYIEVISEDNEGYKKHIFAHLSSFDCKPGDILETGQLFCHSGNSGKYTTGPHLHYGLKECIKNLLGNFVSLNMDNGYNGAIDPKPYFINVWVVDEIENLKKTLDNLKQQISIWRQIINLIRWFRG